VRHAIVDGPATRTSDTPQRVKLVDASVFNEERTPQDSGGVPRHHPITAWALLVQPDRIAGITM